VFPKLLKPSEVAVLLRVAVGTLAVWRSTKRYPLPYLKLGHAVRYRSSDVEHFMKEVAR
jgi:helix-turn-helix protein